MKTIRDDFVILLYYKVLFNFTLVLHYHLVLLGLLQKVMAQTVGMGQIPTPFVSLSASHGHEPAGSSGRMSPNLSWSCQLVLSALSALKAFSLKSLEES